MNMEKARIEYDAFRVGIDAVADPDGNKNMIHAPLTKKLYGSVGRIVYCHASGRSSTATAN